MPQFMWQPAMLRVARVFDAGVKRMQEIDTDAESNVCQPGWLEQRNPLVLSCIPFLALAKGLTWVPLPGRHRIQDCHTLATLPRMLKSDDMWLHALRQRGMARGGEDACNSSAIDLHST